MPHKLNPGPLAARISFFAPVCLGFFVWMFVITLMKGIELHPMNYVFLSILTLFALMQLEVLRKPEATSA